MIRHFLKTVGQLADRRTRKVLWRSAALTAVLLAVLLVAAGMALDRLIVLENELIDGFLAVAGGLAVFVLAMLLFPGLVRVVSAVFLDEVAAATEARHYPDLPPPLGQGAAAAAIAAVRFASIAIVLNLICAPLYLLLLLLPPLGLLLFYAVNGYLLGREYFELVAERRLQPDQAAALRQAHRVRLLVYGAGIAFALTVPIVNLLVPVLATAFMVHVVEAWRRKSGEPLTVSPD